MVLFLSILTRKGKWIEIKSGRIRNLFQRVGGLKFGYSITKYNEFLISTRKGRWIEIVMQVNDGFVLVNSYP